MTKIIIIFVLFLTQLSIGFSGELFVSPENSPVGGTINIKYEPDGRFFMGEDVFARVYAYNANDALPKAYEFALKFDKKESFYTSSFTVPVDVIYLMMKISNGAISDDFKGEFRDVFFLKNSKPVNGCYLKAGITYLGNQPENLNRTIDFKKALDYLKKETELYPDNIQAHIGYTSLLLDLRKIEYPKYSEKMEEILKKGYDKKNENDVRSVSRALRTLNRNDDADELEMKFIKSFPKSQLAEEIFMADLSKANTLEKFSDGVLEYLKKFPVNDNRERIYSALVSGYLQSGDVDEVLEILNKKDDVPSGAYAQIAFALMNNEEFINQPADKRVPKAINLMNISIYGIKKNNLKYKSSYITQNEWEKRNSVRYAGLIEEYGQILMSLEEYNDAYEKYSEAMELYKEEAPVSLYENIIELCNILEKPKTAYKTALLAIENSKDSDVIIDNFKRLHSELNDIADFNSMLIRLKNDARAERIKKLSFYSLNKDFLNVKLQNITGKIVDIGFLKDKVTILQFWSSWCGPCNDALAGFNQLSEIYKDDSNVYFAAVNLWETDEDKKKLVKKYFEDSEISFNLLIDDKNALPYELGITGLPVTCFIGMNGKLEFIEKGYTNEDEFILHSKDKIDLLLKESE
ncbi:redoxin domain-containing protein [Bacteroidota bacterium]